MSTEPQIAAFLDGSHYAVVGASTDRSKYGNMVLRTYLQKTLSVTPVNPKASQVEGLPAVKCLSDITETVHGVSIITPPSVTESVVQEAIRQNIRHIWMQPGAESETAVSAAEAAGIEVIHSGPCLLVVLGFRDAH
ncbi:MAG: CoA-binding protein [Fuerstiella sp.]|nr:CoA-binding protein [Fuerstiella sp.]